MVQSLMFTFAKTFDPDYPIENRPSIDCINTCRSIMKITGEVCAVFELSLADLWAQIFTNGTSLRTNPVQDIIISISEKDVFRPIILAAAVVLEDEETAPAV